MGIQASLLANTKRDSRRRPQPFKATDFMPYHVDAPATFDRRGLEKRLLKTFGLRLDRGKLKKKGH